jgi:hypothetical protein
VAAPRGRGKRQGAPRRSSPGRVPVRKLTIEVRGARGEEQIKLVWPKENSVTTFETPFVLQKAFELVTGALNAQVIQQGSAEE